MKSRLQFIKTVNEINTLIYRNWSKLLLFNLDMYLDWAGVYHNYGTLLIYRLDRMKFLKTLIISRINEPHKNTR